MNNLHVTLMVSSIILLSACGVERPEFKAKSSPSQVTASEAPAANQSSAAASPATVTPAADTQRSALESRRLALIDSQKQANSQFTAMLNPAPGADAPAADKAGDLSKIFEGLQGLMIDQDKLTAAIQDGDFDAIQKLFADFQAKIEAEIAKITAQLQDLDVAAEATASEV